MMMNEWQYNRLKTYFTEHPEKDVLADIAIVQEHTPIKIDKTDKSCIENGWAKVEELESNIFYRKVMVRIKMLTPEGVQAMSDAESTWEKARRSDPEWGPAEFWVMDTTHGQLIVRVPQHCGEIAEYALTQKFGDCYPVHVRKQEDSHQWSGGPGPYLDAMHPENMPHWCTFTGRPLGDRRLEFQVALGLAPDTKLI